MRVSFFLLVGLIAAPAVAEADAISPPPTSCVDGSTGVACHGPPRCAPRDCTTDGECGAGRVCRGTPLCVETISCGGSSPTMDPSVTGQCLTGHCAAGGTCGTRRVCVTSTAPVDDGLDSSAAPDMPAADMPASLDAPAADGGGSHASYGCCSAAGSRGPAGGVLVVVAALATARVRRR